MKSSERAAWFRLVDALSTERELLRRQSYYADLDERPKVEQVVAAMAAVDAARIALRELNINPYTGNRMDKFGRDIVRKS